MSQDPKFKRLIRQLGVVINDSLSESDQVADVLAQIRDAGYDLILVLELTVGFNKRGETTSIVHREKITTDPEKAFQGRLTNQDAAFLKSLRICTED